MKAIFNNTRNAIRRFHNDEAGMETLQVVVIVAIAALVVLMINTWVGTMKLPRISHQSGRRPGKCNCDMA